MTTSAITVAASSASGPTTPILDDFNRPNEDPLSQGGLWAPNDPRGGGFNDLLEVSSQLAGALDNNRFNLSYRPHVYPGDTEAYATVAAKPGIGRNLGLHLGIRQIGGFTWDGYYLTLEDEAGTDLVRLSRGMDNETLVPIGQGSVEVSVGDKLLIRKVGTQLEAWHFSAGSWSLVAAGQDNVLVGGMIGAGIENTAGRWDDFGGGAFVPPPPPPPGPPPEQTFGSDESGDGVHGHSGAGLFADPVNSRTGAFTTAVDDLDLPGTGVSFAWGRSYTSADPTVGRLGPGWTDSYSASLAVQPNDDVRVHGEDGQQLLYVKQPNGSFVGAPGSLSTLTAVTGGYELLRSDQVKYRFDAQGRLLSIKDRNEQGVTLGYDGQNRLSTVTDSLDRQASVTYNAQDLVSQVQAPDGRSVGFGYTNGRLTSVTDVRGKTWTYAYDGGGPGSGLPRSTLRPDQGLMEQ